jgi:DNA-binding MarR family transcriptional regulator
MKEKTSLTLTRELFQLIQQFPRLKFKQNSTHGLTGSEQGLLVMLVVNFDGAKKELKVTEISNLLQITPAGVTHLLNPLEEAGYIKRLQDLSDRRIVLIGLTEKGTRVAESLILDVHENLISLVNYLGEEDSKTFIRLMSKAIGFFTSQFGN